MLKVEPFGLVYGRKEREAILQKEDMMKREKLLMSICLFISVPIFLLTVPLHAEKVAGVTNDLIKVGVILDLTGPTSNAGVVIVEAYKNYIRHINDTGGIHGRKIKLVIEDDHYSIPSAIAAFKKLFFRDEVLAIVGPVSVGEARTLSHHVEKHKIPMLAWAPDKSVIIPYKRYVFPTNGFYSDELGVILDYIVNDLKPANLKIAFCYPDVESGKLLKDHAENWAGVYNLKLHMEVVPMGLIDTTSQVMTMKKAGITHILIHHVAPGAAAVLKDMKKFALDVPVFGTSAACSEDVIRIAGDATRNFLATSHYSSLYEDSPGTKKMREMSLKYNPDAEKSYAIKTYSIGWVIAAILQEGLRRAGKDLDREKLVTVLETIKDFDTGGICGLITYTPEMHYGLRYLRLFKTDPPNGRFIPISNWRLSPSKKEVTVKDAR